MTVNLIIVFLLFIVFLLSGMYVHSVLLTTGIIGLVLLEGFDYLTGFLQAEPFLRVANYSLSTIPLFVLMAQFIIRTGIIQDLFSIVYNLSKGRSGVLGILTVIAGGLMGAVSGSSNASSGSIGQVAIPQLLKRGYSKGIAGATVAAAGSLSSIIPPSIILILWGVATETPISQLFIGAIIPGVVIMIVIITVMFYFMWKGKKDNNDNENHGIKFIKEIISLKNMIIASLTTLAIVVLVFYGIYTGIVTPTEAGAVGAFISFVIAVILGKVNVQFFVISFKETVKLTAMIMMIMIGAQIFGRFVSVSLLPRKIIEFLSTLIEYPILILIILSLIYFILFMFIEGAAVIIMTAPFVYPLILEMGTDPLWFGVVVSILCTLGLLTPPVGLSVFAVSGVTGINSTIIFRYSIQYAIIIAITIITILIIFPGIVTYLPSRM